MAQRFAGGAAGNPIAGNGHRDLPIPFQDPTASTLSLGRVCARVSAQLAAALPALLAESPDPDSSVLLLERLLSESSEEIARLLERHPHLAHYAMVVFGHSRFLGETLIRNTDLLQSFLREKNLDRSFSREEFRESLARFRSRSFETDMAVLLARFKRREYVRIMLRDVLRIAPLAETTAEISALADVLIEEALREAESELQGRFGPAQHLDSHGRLVDTPFAILSLGKLGGNELNYSSDVDLMYLYGDGEEPPTPALSGREYFVRLAQRVTDLLSRLTLEGPVFRIDLRLRPQGGQGELAVSLQHALAYYAEAAQDWELQAMIKVRHSAGDTKLARSFIREVQPRVYTEQINFQAIETALKAREKMRTRRHNRLAVERQAHSINVKLDHGGIRDIEFLVQCLQRVYGGTEPWLRSGGTLFSLQKLHDKRHISGKEFQQLSSAYEFLRHLEHRLQLRQGQQTHRLPGSPEEMLVLQRSLLQPEQGESPAENLVSRVQRRMAGVTEIYNRIIHHQQAHQLEPTADKPFQLLGTPEAEAGEQSNQQILGRLMEDAPEVHAIVCKRGLSSQARKNLFRFLSSALTSSERYAAVVQHPEAFDTALALFEYSEHLTEILLRHPEELAALAQSATPQPRPVNAALFESGRGQQSATGDPVFAYVAQTTSSHGEKLALLRRHYRHRILVAGAKDVIQHRDVYESLSETSAAAEDAIAAAYAIAGAPEGLAVLALGRLGTSEFDVLSDADLLFVYDANCDRLTLTRAAEEIMQTLAAYTRDGTLFSVDARLRPRGAEGELLVSPEQLLAYFEQEAQPWEALTYTKLRFLTGSSAVGSRAMASTESLFRRYAADPAFAAAVCEMRRKLEAGDINLKTSPGGIYDVDFLVSYLLVKHQTTEKRGSLRDCLWGCAESGWLDKAEAAALDHAAELLRTVEHVIRLVVGRTRKWLPVTGHARQVTETWTSQVLQRHFSEGLAADLTSTCQVVRSIYEKVLAA